MNNYYIRSLLGPRFFELPVMQVNDTHKEKAMLEVREEGGREGPEGRAGRGCEGVVMDKEAGAY